MFLSSDEIGKNIETRHTQTERAGYVDVPKASGLSQTAFWAIVEIFYPTF